MSDTKKVIMLGNEAIARGAYEAGVKVSAAYPGTPKHGDQRKPRPVQGGSYTAEWAPNEKVAAESGHRSVRSSGVRCYGLYEACGTQCGMPTRLYTVSYMGVNGGLLIVVADDPGTLQLPERAGYQNGGKGGHSCRYWSRPTARRRRSYVKVGL